jgi:hypothetical protein
MKKIAFIFFVYCLTLLSTACKVNSNAPCTSPVRSNK